MTKYVLSSLKKYKTVETLEPIFNNSKPEETIFLPNKDEGTY